MDRYTPNMTSVSFVRKVAKMYFDAFNRADLRREALIWQVLYAEINQLQCDYYYLATLHFFLFLHSV